MAKTQSPLLSWGASGTIAKTQVYASWKGRPYARRHVIPANPNSAEQQLTRNTFKYLNDLWKYLPAGAIGAWNLYAETNRFTPRNGWFKQNIGPLREQVTLEDIILSVSAGSGLIASDITVTPGDDQLTLDLVAPSLPNGWTITKAIFMVVRNVNPQSSTIFDVKSAEDATSTYQAVITGLANTTEYVCGGWFEYLKPNGDVAYGASLQDLGTTT